MFPVFSKKQNNISNLIIKTNYENENDITVFDFNINYIDETNLNLEVTILDGEKLILNLINSVDNNDNIEITIYKKLFNENITTPFKLIKNESTNIYKIPKIIHQSYKKNVKKKMYNAINSWKLMNINFEYKYWDDDECYKLIQENYDENILDAYNSLYSGAYKSDIFRLCALYKYGGVWTDISSTCKYPLDKIIEENINLTIVKDNPSQVIYGNIYQAFIIVEKNNEIIKSILNFTVNKILNHEEYDKIYPFLVGEAIAVTGPTAFAIGLNKYLSRPDTMIINDEYIYHNWNNILNNIKFLNHYPGKIVMNDILIVETKYNNWIEDRTGLHYSFLCHQGYIYKKKIKDVNVDILKPCIYQIFIQSEFTSNNMYESIQTIINHNKDFNYKLLTNNKIIKLIENDQEFPLLLKAYNKLKPYAYKSDLIRYYILYKYGGVYIDIDFVSINEIKELHNNYDIVICKDLDANGISNGFISSKKGNLFFKFVVEKLIDNLFNKNEFNYKSDLEITGPLFFGKCFRSYFNIDIPFFQGHYNLNNNNIKILNHATHLPLPNGSWMNSSRNYYVEYNILHAECKTISEGWDKSEIAFFIEDEVHNSNGKLVNNVSRPHNFDKASSFYFDENKIYFNTKYCNYNYEKLILLDGNDYATMFQNNNIIIN